MRLYIPILLDVKSVKMSLEVKAVSKDFGATLKIPRTARGGRKRN